MAAWGLCCLHVPPPSQKPIQSLSFIFALTNWPLCAEATLCLVEEDVEPGILDNTLSPDATDTASGAAFLCGEFHGVWGGVGCGLLQSVAACCSLPHSWCPGHGQPRWPSTLCCSLIRPWLEQRALSVQPGERRECRTHGGAASGGETVGANRAVVLCSNGVIQSQAGTGLRPEREL